MSKLKIIALILLVLPFAAQAQVTRELKPVKGHHATPSWVKVQGSGEISEKQLMKHIGGLQYNLQSKDIRAGKNGTDPKKCKKHGSVTICQKD